MNQDDFTSERTSLAKVQQEFEAWRNTRTKRTTIPEYLWQAAVDLSPHYSLTKISRTLSVDYRFTADNPRVVWENTNMASHFSSFVYIDHLDF